MDEFYGTAAAFKAYHTARGRDVTMYTDDAAIEAALLVASEWLDNAYRPVWMGYKLGMNAQEREWPRTGVINRYGYAVDSASVPVQVERATYEMALRELQSPGSLAIDFTPSQYSRVAIAGSVSVDYRPGIGAGSVQKQFPIIAQILDPLIGRMGERLSSLSGSTVRA